MESTRRILLIDQDDRSRKYFKSLITSSQFQDFVLFEADNINEAKLICREQEQELIIVNNSVSDQAVVELLGYLKTENHPTSVIYLTDRKEERKAIGLVDFGAKDYLIKEDLTASYFVHRINKIIEKMSLSQLLQRQANEINELSNLDPLTRLPNRDFFESALLQTCAKAKRHDRLCAVLLINIDHFKEINSTFNHNVGDAALKEVAQRIKAMVRNEDLVTRLWSDFFAVVLTEIKEVFDAGVVAKKILAAINKPFLAMTNEVVISVSIGISVYPNSGRSSDVLMKNAETAMNRVAQSGGNNYQFYHADTQDDYMQKVMLENDLLFVLERNELFLRFQPKFDLITKRLSGVETLVRWRHPKLGEVAADKFLKIAEENGFIVTIGNWVIEKACEQLSKWQKQLSGIFHLSINLSLRQLAYEKLPTIFADAIQKYNLDPKQICVELPEKTLDFTSGFEEENIKKLRELGIMLTIDNFGSGLSMIKNIEHKKIDAIKINRGIISKLDTDQSDKAIVLAIIILCKTLGIKVIAEGVENDQQKNILLENDCTDAQGYLFSKPITEEEMSQLLSDQAAGKTVL